MAAKRQDHTEELIHTAFALLVHGELEEFVDFVTDESLQKHPRVRNWMRLATNLQVLFQIHPGLKEELLPVLASTRLHGPWQPAKASGYRTLSHKNDDGQRIALHGSDPYLRQEKYIREWRKAQAMDHSMVFCSLDDGSLLESMSAELKPSADGRLTQIWVAVEDPRHLLAVLRVRSWSRKGGVLLNPAIRFLVGKQQAPEQLTEILRKDYRVPVPRFFLGTGEWLSTLQHECKKASVQRQAVWRELNTDVEQKNISGDLSKLMQQGTGLRVLLVGNRFHQHSRSDMELAQAAFVRRGWDASTLIEKYPTQRLTPAFLRQRIASWKPHLIVGIHQPMLSEFGAIPEGLPSIALVPDEGLCKPIPGVGLTVRKADAFSAQHLGLSSNRHLYVATGVFPPPEALQNFAEEPVDEVVSLGLSGLGTRTMVWMRMDAPPSLEQLAEEAVQQATHSESLSKAVQTVTEEIVQGKAYVEASPVGVRVRLALADPSLPEGAMDNGVRALSPLLQACFALETARWASTLCEDLLLAFALHGRGWRAYPDLSPYALRPIESHVDLMQLVQRGTVGLFAEPGFFMRQMLLDSISAGSLMLIREHPFHVAFIELARFLHANAPRSSTLAHAREQLASDPQQLIQLETLSGWFSAMLPPEKETSPDPVVLVRSCLIGGVVDSDFVPIPGYPDIRFATADALEERILHWMAEPMQRRKLVKNQQQALMYRLGLHAHLLRATQTVGQIH